MFCQGFDAGSVKNLADGSKKAVVHLVCADAPATMPLNGANMDGFFPSPDGKDTSFMPGSDCIIRTSGTVRILDDNYVWGEL